MNLHRLKTLSYQINQLTEMTFRFCTAKAVLGNAGDRLHNNKFCKVLGLLSALVVMEHTPPLSTLWRLVRGLPTPSGPAMEPARSADVARVHLS